MGVSIGSPVRKGGSPDGVTLLVDGDIIAYQAANVTDGRCYTVAGKNFKYKADAVSFTGENFIKPSEIRLAYYPDPEHVAWSVVNQMMDGVMLYFMEMNIPVKTMEVFLSSDNNFRYNHLPFYKISRKPAKDILNFFGGDMTKLCNILGTTPETFTKRLEDPLDGRKPENLNSVEQFMRDKWDAISEDLLEADDLLGIRMGEVDKGVIVTVDKDLGTVPGKHYNPDKKELFDVSPEEATLNFYAQCLSGDKTDTIPGLKGFAEITSKKHLSKHSPSSHPKDLWPVVKEAWVANNANMSHFQAAQAAIDSASCLYIMQKRGVYWSPPFSKRR